MTGQSTFPEPREWSVAVVEVVERSPSMRRVRLSGEDFARLVYLPGQDMAVAVPTEDGTTVRRRYTIRSFDRETGTADLDFVLHGDGPACRWASAASPGDEVDVIAPRGKVTVDAAADWHLFAGDETAVPGIAAMVESLPRGALAIALLEVDRPVDADRIDVPAGVEADVRWLYREGEGPGGGERLTEVLRWLPLPEGNGHAYVAGEYSVVHALRRALADRGLDQSQVSPKPYWRIGRRNMAHGEPERD